MKTLVEPSKQLQVKGDIVWPKSEVQDSSNCFFQHLEEDAPQPRHVHQHDSRVDARPAVEGVAGEAVVPRDAGLLVLRSHGSQLRGIKVGEEGPEAVDGLQEEDVRIHVQDGVHVF